MPQQHELAPINFKIIYLFMQLAQSHLLVQMSPDKNVIGVEYYTSNVTSGLPLSPGSVEQSKWGSMVKFAFCNMFMMDGVSGMGV